MVRRPVGYLREKEGAAAYTRAMRRPIVIAAGLLVAALIVAGGVVALSPAEPAGPAYTVAEVTTGLRQHPSQWVGRTVAVRGVAMGLSVGGGSSGSYWP